MDISTDILFQHKTETEMIEIVKQYIKLVYGCDYEKVMFKDNNPLNITKENMFIGLDIPQTQLILV
jgi:hypothetical protein